VRVLTGRAALPVGTSVRIVADVLRGLGAAHHLRDDRGQHVGVMHRDVCPANILIGLDGVAKLADFGIARAGDAVVGLDHGERRGKKGYAAPERSNGTTVPQSDLYSVAVVAWEILLGGNFATCDDPKRILEREGIPVPIAEVVLKSLSPDPRLRHSSADVFADELERAAQKTGCTGSTRDVAEWASRVFERPYDHAGSSAPGLHSDCGTLRTTVALDWPTPSSVDIPAVTTTAGHDLPRTRPWRRVASILAMAAVMLVGPLAWSARDGGARRTVIQSRQFEPGLATDTDAPRHKEQPEGPRLPPGAGSSFHKATPTKAARGVDSTAPADRIQPPSATGPRLGFTNPYE
jgi:serine/threonine protein kinase